MEPRTNDGEPAWVGIWVPLGLGLVVGLTGVFMILCALAACGDGRQASVAALVRSYDGSSPFPAVIGESVALTPAVFWTIGHYTVNSSECPPQSGHSEPHGTIVVANSICGTLTVDSREIPRTQLH